MADTLERPLITASTIFYGVNGTYSKFKVRIQRTMNLVDWTTVAEYDNYYIQGSDTYGYFHDGIYYFVMTKMSSEDNYTSVGNYLVASSDGTTWSDPFYLSGIPYSTFNTCGFKGVRSDVMVFSWGSSIYTTPLPGVPTAELACTYKSTWNSNGIHYTIPGCTTPFWCGNGRLYVPSSSQWSTYYSYGTAVITTAYTFIGPVFYFGGYLWCVGMANFTANNGYCDIYRSTIANATSAWTKVVSGSSSDTAYLCPRAVAIKTSSPYIYNPMNYAHQIFTKDGALYFCVQSAVDSYYGVHVIKTTDMLTFTSVGVYDAINWYNLRTWGFDGTTFCYAERDPSTTYDFLDTYSFTNIAYPFATI